MKAYVISPDTKTWETFLQHWQDIKTLEFERIEKIVDWKLHAEKFLSGFCIVLEAIATPNYDFDLRFPKIIEWLILHLNEWDVFYGGFTFPIINDILDEELRIVQGQFLTSHFLIISNGYYPKLLSRREYEKPFDLWLYWNESRKVTTSPMLSYQIEYHPLFWDSELKVDQELILRLKKRWDDLFKPTDRITFFVPNGYNLESPSIRRLVTISKSIPHPHVTFSTKTDGSTWIITTEDVSVPTDKNYRIILVGKNSIFFPKADKIVVTFERTSPLQLDGFYHRKFQRKDLDQSFLEKHHHFFKARGYNYGLWKPQICLQAFREMATGAWLLFMGDSQIPMNLENDIPNITPEISFIVFPDSQKIERKYCKMDVVEYLLGEKFLNTVQYSSSYFLIMKTEKNEAFLERWLELCENYHLLDDSRSILPNDPEFITSNRETSLFSLLYKKTFE